MENLVKIEHKSIAFIVVAFFVFSKSNLSWQMVIYEVKNNKITIVYSVGFWK